MPVRPKPTKYRDSFPHYEKPEHTKPAKERSFAVARDLIGDPGFTSNCERRGVKPTIRQARKFLAGAEAR